MNPAPENHSIPRHSLLTRWYMILAIAFVLFSFMLATGYATLMILDPYMEFDLSSWSASTFGMLAITVVWTTWALPWFLSGDRLIEWTGKPTRIINRLHFVMFMLPMMIGIYAVAVGGYEFWKWLRLSGRYHHSAFEIKENVYLFVACAVALTLTWFYWVVLKSRLARNAVDRRVCGQCGYDLHACVTPACPECGEPIPWLAGREHGA